MPLSPEGEQALDQLLSACDAARQELDKQRTSLGVRLNQLEMNAAPPQDEIDKLNAAIDALTDADNELSVITLEALDSSAAVRDMATSLKAVNAGLQNKLKAVQKTAQQLQDVAKFIGQIDGIVKSLAKIAALFV